MEARAYNETFTLPAAEGEDSELMRLWMVIDTMQKAAGRHVEKLGVGFRDFHAKALTYGMYVEISLFSNVLFTRISANDVLSTGRETNS
jgi:hypothetical protein